MNKSIEAFLRGYLLFRVNGEWFFTYNRARNRRLEVAGDVSFEGFHFFKGWRVFFCRRVFMDTLPEEGK